MSTFVGARTDIPYGGSIVQLLAGSNVLASNSSVTPAAGTFAPANVTYTSGSSDADIGQPLSISLISNGVSQTQRQTEFDNVTLNAQPSTPVPFEFSPGLGILALGAMGAIAQLKSQMQKLKLKT